MLPLWPDQLLVTLSTTHVAVLHRTGFRKHVLAYRESVITPHPEHAWQASLHTLERLLTAMTIPSGIALHITLESDLVRYLVLPPTFQYLSLTDKTAYAQAAFREIFGSDALHWTIQADDTPPFLPTVCAAIDQPLLSELQYLIEKLSLNLKSMQPYFSRAFNRLRPSLGKLEGVLLLAERNRLILASFANNACTHIRTQALHADWLQQLPETLARTSIMDETMPRLLSVYAPASKTTTLPTIPNWQTKRAGLTHTPLLPTTVSPWLEIMA